MTLASAALRVLLVFALLVNGVAGAMASPVRAIPSAVAGAGCHDHAAMAHHPVKAAADSASTLHPHPDHCTPDHCRCACMPSLQAATPLAVLLPAVPNRAHGVRVAIPTRSDPALPHLIRPPIG